MRSPGPRPRRRGARGRRQSTCPSVGQAEMSTYSRRARVSTARAGRRGSAGGPGNGRWGEWGRDNPQKAPGRRSPRTRSESGYLSRRTHQPEGQRAETPSGGDATVPGGADPPQGLVWRLRMPLVSKGEREGIFVEPLTQQDKVTEELRGAGLPEAAAVEEDVLPGLPGLALGALPVNGVFESLTVVTDGRMTGNGPGQPCSQPRTATSASR